MTTTPKHDTYVVAYDAKDKAGKSLSTLYKLTKAGPDLERPYYVMKRTGSSALHVGNVYEIPTEVKDQSTFFVIGAKKWLREYEDKAKAAAWQIEQKSIELADAAVRLEKKMASDASSLNAAIAPLKRAYRAMPQRSRIAFEVWLLSELKKGIISL